MAKLDWDRVHFENVSRSHGSEIVRDEGERYYPSTGLKFHPCPFCGKLVKLSKHIRRVHGSIKPIAQKKRNTNRPSKRHRLAKQLESLESSRASKSALDSPFLGRWVLRSIERVGQRGEITRPYGGVVYGVLIYGSNLSVSETILSLPRKAKNIDGYWKLTQRELNELFAERWSYQGKYRFDGTVKSISHIIESASDPTLFRGVLTRSYEFFGRERIVMTSAVDSSGAVMNLIWERADH